MAAMAVRHGTPPYIDGAVLEAVLFRNACNEVLSGAAGTPERGRLLAMASTSIQRWRWLTNGGIAVRDAIANR
jgi:hypothetical protein